MDIEIIKDYELPFDERDFWNSSKKFAMAVANVVIQIRINSGKRNSENSVVLNDADKQKIRHYVEQIKTLVDESGLATDKKEEILKKLNAFLLAIDLDRTPLGRFTDTIRVLTRLSSDVAKEGAEPWWKWVAPMLGVVDKAKEKEDQSRRPWPGERKKIEAPRKRIEGPKSSQDLDDDIPF